MTQAVAPGAHARGANPASVGRRWTSRVARNECCGNPACRACQSAVRGPPSGLPLTSPRSFTLLAPSATGRFSSGPPISSGANRPGPRNTPCAPAADVDSRCGPQCPRPTPLAACRTHHPGRVYCSLAAIVLPGPSSHGTVSAGACPYGGGRARPPPPRLPERAWISRSAARQRPGAQGSPHAPAGIVAEAREKEKSPAGVRPTAWPEPNAPSRR